MKYMVLLGVVLTMCLASYGIAHGIVQENRPPALHILPGKGVADPGAKTGFFPNTSGGIDALNLATGKVLWSNKDANLPLVATSSYLFALKGKGNQLRVIKMDTSKKGQRLFTSPPLPLPDWASVEPAYGRSFRSSVRLDSKGWLLSWEARAFYAGGAAPPPEVEANARKYQSGVARIDSNTGKIAVLDAKQITAGKFFPIAEVAENPKIGSLTLRLQDSSTNNPHNPFERRRTLQAVNGAKQVVWQRDIAPPIELLPLP